MVQGRHSTYTEEMGMKICGEMAEGKSLTKICQQDNFPSASTVFHWLTKYKDFADQYARAQLARTEFLMDGLVDIADDCDNMDVNKARLRVDTRKWAISKMYPKKYGDKIETTHAGTVEINQIKRVIVDPTK